MNQVLRVFMNADMRNGHDGLTTLAEKSGIKSFEGQLDLAQGQFLVFINAARNKIKVFAPNNVVGYLRMPQGKILDLSVVSEIPKAFNGDPKIGYDEALKARVMKELATRNAPAPGSPLEIYKAKKTRLDALEYRG